ncbi:MAG: alpha/beta hydrolase [Candidatus Hydrogenedentes bacterium]|nr:alpha/beta hydrolase [Candidatus Hydrogenedentota bacterium]
MTSLDAWCAKGKHFDYRGYPIFYVEEGSGEPLVCIHGFPTASWDWAWVWPELTKRFRVIAPDMIGFGFSAKPRAYEYSLRDQATLHEQLLADLGVNAAIILAHDYGDTVAQELLARFEERNAAGADGLRIRGVCFLNGGIIPGEHRPRPMQKLLAGPFGALIGRLTNERTFNRSFSEIFGPNTQPSREELAQFWRLIEHNGGRYVLHKVIRYMRERMQYRDRWVHALQAASVPRRFVNGPEDPVSGRHMAETYARIVPDADVVLIEGIGHYPQVEAPEQVLEAFDSFVTTLR